MKSSRLQLGVFLAALGLMFTVLTGCGGSGGNKDAEAFCDCVKKLESGNDDPKCDTDMEKLEDEFKADPKRYEAFKTAAMESCPQAKDLIERMN